VGRNKVWKFKLLVTDFDFDLSDAMYWPVSSGPLSVDMSSETEQLFHNCCILPCCTGYTHLAFYSKSFVVGEVGPGLRIYKRTKGSK